MHGYDDVDWGSHMGWGWGWMVVMPLVWIVLIAVAVWAFTMLLRRDDTRAAAGQRPIGGPTGRETPEEILDRRLAEGTIEPDAYDAVRRRLAENRGS